MKRLFIMAVFMAANVRGAAWYVGPAGDDAHTGRGPEPGRAFRTIQAGVDKLRPGDTLLVRGGVYRETVVFPRSGAPGRPITVKPYQGEKVLVTGGDPVEGWTRHKGRVWKAPMPWTLGTGRNQIFAGGEVMIEARHPNKPAPGLGMYVSDLSPLWPTFGEFSIPDPKQHPGRLVSKLLDGQPDNYWKGAIYYGVHYQGWCAQTGVVERSGPGYLEVGDRTRVWWFGPAYGGRYKPEEGRGMLVGHVHALDQPGEWHWQDNTLYLIPRGGGPPREVEAKRRQLAFDLSGREHIRIEGIRVQAASLRLADSANCVVDRCDLSYISHFTRQYSIGQVEHGRDTIKSGETGIYVSGRDNAFLNCRIRYSAGAGFHLRGYHHTIHNCLIDEVDYTSHYLNAVTDAVSDFNNYENFLVGGHVITFNTMRNAGRHFFNFYGNGTSKASRDRAPMDYMATLFAHNHLYNGMLQTKDAGLLTGYYSSGGTLNGLNSQVVYNVLHDSYDIFAMRIHKLGLIYLDAGTCDVDLHHNLLWAAPGSLQRGLWYNTMCVDVHERDNVFHEMFERTCAELTPEDFPEGRPFRFGCDFDNPPPLPQWPQLETHQLRQISPIRLTAATRLCLGDVDLDAGWQSAVLRFASNVKAMNTDRSARARPRHKKATDPLVLEATLNDGVAEGVRKQWSFIYNTGDGRWVRFNQVPLGQGYRRFRAIYGVDSASPRWLEVRLDQPDGPLVGRVDLPRTDRPRKGRIQIYSEATAAVSPSAAGLRDVFVVFRSEDGLPVGEFEYFRFEQYRGAIPLQKNEVKLELRVGAKDGEKIGEFYPRFTGGADVFKDMVAKLEPASGKHPLFVVVRSAIDAPIGAIDGIRLQKAKQPPNMSGIGLPPRRDAAGRLILPQPTHRPCARPADKYPARRPAASPRPQPVFVAKRLDAAPVLDGRLDEWRGRAMRLAESWDGAPSAGLPSKAWVAYDDNALYIAVKNAVKDPKRLKIEGHRWGATDAMEVAFQDATAAQPGPILNLYGWPDGHFVSTDQAGAPADVVAKLGAAVAYKATITEDGWSCEWRIPFAACGFTPKTAALLSFNLGVRKPAVRAWVIWRGTGAPTYVVSNAGLLVFPAEFAAQDNPPKKQLEVWLDASDAATVEKDAAGLVSAWLDKSGHGRHARQAVAQHRPRYSADALGGKPALMFDEKRMTRLDLPDLSDKQISATIFVVFSNPKPGAPVNHHPRLFTASDGKGYDYKVGLCACVPGTETGGPREMVVVNKNGWAKRVRVGCFSPLYQTFFHGCISEILVYSRELDRPEHDRIRAYLACKWDLE